MLYVQHLLGIGHLSRSLQFATALQREGFRVEVVSGGMPSGHNIPDALRFTQLDPVYSPDASFKHLLNARGEAVDEAWKAARTQQLLGVFEETRPAALITETFPFGRRMMRYELTPLLNAARDSSDCQLIISSIRDILQPKSDPRRNQETCEIVNACYDQVIVHGDPRIATLGDSFSMAGQISDKVHYSGYIAVSHAPQPSAEDGRDEVLVSAGGSTTGLSILETAIAARPKCSLAKLDWRILVSPGFSEVEFERLSSHQAQGLIIERNRPDFNGLLKRCRLSISQAGYNTVTDILGSRANAIVIPFDEAAEVEQTLRAEALERAGRLKVLKNRKLSATSLAFAIDQSADHHVFTEFDLNGADHSARLVGDWLGEKGVVR